MCAICAALAVVFSHAILLSTGGEEAEPFQWLTGEILGVYGGFIFFMLSGVDDHSHLDLLRKLAEILTDGDRVEELKQASDVDAVLALVK